ncbi:MAG: DUF2339 domain-containing protein, partial [Sphingopyxis sp.]
MLAGALRMAVAHMPARAMRWGIAGVAAMALVAGHSLYRMAFAGAIGADFAQYGLAQRLVWDGLLMGAAVALWRRSIWAVAHHVPPVLVGVAAGHALWYSLVLHNPLWAAQAVGPWPILNLLAPLFAILPVALHLGARMRADLAARLDVIRQPLLMVMVAAFAWASLRHAFHGAMLTQPGLPPAEDISRSLLGITLAVGYLLWGIRQQRRDWRLASLCMMLAAVAKVFLLDASGLYGLLRIGSFVALGFSLIGIGWLYARQLKTQQA